MNKKINKMKDLHKLIEDLMKKIDVASVETPHI